MNVCVCVCVCVLPQEVGLLGLAEVADSHMRQHLFLQHLFGVLDSPLLGDAWLGTTGPDEVQRHVLLLDHKRLIQGRFHLRGGRGTPDS